MPKHVVEIAVKALNEVGKVIKKTFHEAVTLRGAGTVLVAACPMPLLTNTASGRRSFHKQPPEFCI